MKRNYAPVAIVDYGSGNLASVANMVRKVGGQAELSCRKEDLRSASKLILPGVGAFDHGIRQLQKLDLFEIVQEKASTGTPLLGMCLGMQLLGQRSEEGRLAGLGLLDLEFRRLPAAGTTALRVPHVGWNHVRVVRPNPLLSADDAEQRFYFSHSYYAVCANETDVLGMTDYGAEFPSAYGRGRVFGVQFHPEKSHRFGMALMTRFLEL